MKEIIIEIVELGHPQSLIQRKNTPITELINTNLLIEELNKQLSCFNFEKIEQIKYCTYCGNTFNNNAR